MSTTLSQAGATSLDRPAPQSEPAPNKYLVSLAVIFGVMMSAIDSSIVNVAMPQIQGNVGATQQEVTWISTGYMISVVILMPLANWFSVRYGRKRVYLCSLTLFVASSILCGLSRTLGQLIFWRVIQGSGAGMMQTLAQAIFREAFPREEQGKAMGLFGFVVVFGPAIGPTVGGYITDNYSWPWIFFINVPIGFIGFFTAIRYLYDPPYMRGGVKKKIDGVGIGLLAIGLAATQTVLEQGETEDWFNSDAIVAGAVVAVVALVAFFFWESYGNEPVVDLRVLKDPTFTMATIIGTIIGLGLFASIFLLPQYMQLMLGFTATQCGLTLMPQSLVMIVGMPIAGAAYNRLGPKWMIGGGLLVAAYAQYIMSRFTLETGVQDILLPQILQGAAFAFVFIGLSTVALSNIAPNHMTSAAGLNNLFRQMGGSFGTSIVVTLLTRQNDAVRSNLVHHFQSANPLFVARLSGATAMFVHAGYGTSSARDAALRLTNQLLARQTIMVAYDYVFALVGVMFMLCLPLILFLKQPPGVAASAERKEERTRG